MFASDLVASAGVLLDLCRAQGLKITTAESCTGGLVGGLLTEIAGSSDVYERGFITYSNTAKMEQLAVARAVIEGHGAVSAAVAAAMADGALKHAHADIAVAVTGIAGPGGGTAQKPVGLVYIAAQRRGDAARIQRFTFGDIGRSEIRLSSVREAIAMLRDVLDGPAT